MRLVYSAASPRPTNTAAAIQQISALAADGEAFELGKFARSLDEKSRDLIRRTPLKPASSPTRFSANAVMRLARS